MRTLNSLFLLIVVFVVGSAGAARAVNLGPDDRQVTITGPAGTTATDAHTPVVAFDSVNQRYLLVWSADEVDGEFHIYGRLLSGGSGANIGSAFQISPNSMTEADHRQPAVAYSPDHGRFLVIWSGDDVNPGAYEIHGQLVDPDGQLIGTPQRYSDMGSNDADPAYDAVTPDLAWHPFLDTFVVVWAADDDLGDLLDGRFEIYGQLVDGASGAETGDNDFRITYSLSGPVQNDILEPTVAVHPVTDRWFMAFEADITDDTVHDPEIWMYGCSGDIPDPAAFNLSLMGGSYFDGLSARNPDLAWVPSSGELICVWDGQDGSPHSPAIFGQRIAPDGSLIGSMLSFSAGAGTIFGDLREATHPSITVDPLSDDWFIAWRGDLNDGLTHFDHEVWARRFDDVGSPVDVAAFRLSNMDPALDPVAGAGAPVVAINSVHGYKLIAWSGDLDSTPGGEHEIFVQGWADDGASPADPTPTVTFALHGAAPNPFNPSTTIAFDLPRSEPVSVHVYDAAGRRVRTLLSEEPGQAGRNEVVWNGLDDGGRQVASGVYMYRLQTPTARDVGRMTLIK